MTLKPCLALALLTPLFLAGCGGSHHETTPTETTRDTISPTIFFTALSNEEGAFVQIGQADAQNQRIPIVGTTTPLIVSTSLMDDGGLDANRPPQALIYSANGMPFASFPLTAAPRQFDKYFWQGQATLQQELRVETVGLKTVVVEATDASGNRTTVPAGTFFFGTREGLSTSVPQPLPPFTSTAGVGTSTSGG